MTNLEDRRGRRDRRRWRDIAVIGKPFATDDRRLTLIEEESLGMFPLSLLDLGMTGEGAVGEI